MSVEQDPNSLFPADFPNGDPVNAWGVYLESLEIAGNVPPEAVEDLYHSVDVPEDIPAALERVAQFSQTDQ